MKRWALRIVDERLFKEPVRRGNRPFGLRFIALINQMRIGIRAEVAVQLFVLFDDDQNGYLATWRRASLRVAVMTIAIVALYI